MKITKRLTSFEFALLYIYIGAIVNRLLDVPEIIKSILALPTFILLPFLTGIVLVELTKLLQKERLKTTLFATNISHLIFYFLIGTIFIEFAAVILQIFHFNLMLKNIGYLILIIDTIGLLYLRFSKSNMILGRSVGTYTRRYFSSILLMLSIVFVPFFIKMFFVQAPLTTWTSWTNPIAHVQAVLRVLDRGFLDLTQRWMEIILTSVSCQLFNINSPEFFSYTGTLLVSSMLSLGTFALVYRLSSKTYISLISGILSIFLNAPLGFQEIPAYHFKSNTLLIGLFPWILFLLIDLLNKQKISKLKDFFKLTIPVGLVFLGLTCISSITLVSTFYSYGISYETQLTLVRPIIIMMIPIAFVAYSFVKNQISNLTILLLACTVLYTTNEADFVLYLLVITLFILGFYVTTKRHAHRLICIIALLFFATLFLMWNNVITMPDISISSFMGYESVTANIFHIKKLFFSDGNSEITQYLFALGLVMLIFSHKKNDSLALWASTMVFFVYFFPDYWSARSLGATTPFIAYAISKNMDFLAKTVGSISVHRKKINILNTCSCALLFFVVITPNLVSPLSTKFSTFPSSQIAPYEYETAVWLRENTKETEVIVSDYWTMMLINPISNKIWLTDRQFMAESLDPEYHYLLTELKNKVFTASSSIEAYTTIQSLAHTMRVGVDWTEQNYCNNVGINPENITFLIILSSRTAKWLVTQSMDVMGPQYSKIAPSFLSIFNDNRYFEPIFQTPEQIYVFRVTDNGC